MRYKVDIRSVTFKYLKARDQISSQTTAVTEIKVRQHKSNIDLEKLPKLELFSNKYCVWKANLDNKNTRLYV